MLPCDEPRIVLSMVAHELREPLAVIRAYVSLLHDGVLSDGMRDEALALIDRKAQEADALVGTMLFSARLESRGSGRVPVAFDVAEVVRRAMAEVASRAARDGATIRLEMQAAPAFAVADPDHVCRVLVNVLQNALSYSVGPPWVTIAIRMGDPVEVAVGDRGAGIELADQDRIFEPFERAAGGPTRQVAGLGLGLSISRRLAELNGGSLELEHSAPGDGSVFVLRLPAAG